MAWTLNGPRRRTLLRGLAPVALSIIVGACSASTASPSGAPAASTAASAAASQSAAAPSAAGSKDMILATTTSTQDSGLLEVLIPAFEAASGYKVKPVAVGSGAAIQLGQEGNADVLFVHSPKAEKDFVDAGWGVDRTLVMHNHFLLVGPASDPAGIKGMTSASDALKKIASSGSLFVSRGDKSGTETKELALWTAAGITPKADSKTYIQTGQGMLPTLQIASEKGGYTLSDDATFLANKSKLQLDSLVTGDNALVNIYHVIVVNPAKWPKVNNAGADAFKDYVVSAAGQAVIAAYGTDKFGQPLFTPDAGKTESDLK
jgi:tungstate transport system substrate-binding protein